LNFADPAAFLSKRGSFLPFARPSAGSKEEPRMVEQKLTTEEARQGKTGQGVRYVLGMSLLGAAIGLGIVGLAVL
jgi:hypothetical protein